VEGSNTRSADLAVVLVEPQVVGSVGPQVQLIAVQVSVPVGLHFINNYNYKSKSKT